LLVEDDQIDAKAFVRAIEKAKTGHSVTVARDGVEPWELLKGHDADDPHPGPDLAILDINMPRMSGLELLRRIRSDKELCNLIVFILTTSNDAQDKLDAYHLNAAGYILKSGLNGSLARIVELIESYRQIVEFPADPVPADPQPAARTSVCRPVM